MTDTASIFDTETEEEIGGIFDEPQPEQEIFAEDSKPPPDRYSSRASGENLIGGAFVAIGTVLIRRRIDPGVGRCLAFEAPLAGQQIDKIIAYTWLDRILQPLFRKADEAEGIGAILALPIMVGAVERKPELAPYLMPIMEEVSGVIMDDMLPVLRKQRSKKRRTVRNAAELTDAFEIPKGEKNPEKWFVENYLFADYVIQPEGESNGATT